MIRPKNLEHLVVFKLRGIKFDLHNFRVAGLVAANILVAWIFLGSAGVADRGRGNAFQFAKGFFHAPETTCSECRFLCHVDMIKRECVARKMERSVSSSQRFATDCRSGEDGAGKIDNCVTHINSHAPLPVSVRLSELRHALIPGAVASTKSPLK